MKKVWSFGLVLLCLIIVSACGSSNNNGSDATGQPAATPQGSASPTDSGDAAPEQPFAGQKLTLYLSNTNWGSAIEQLLPAFEAETGINVEMESFAEKQLTEKVSIQFTTGSSSPDVYMFRPPNEGKLFYANGWMEPLGPYIEKVPDFDLADFSDVALSQVTYDEQVAGIPGIANTQIIYYRKDLLENAGLAVPTTLDELAAAIQKLHDPKNEIYGFIARGGQTELVGQTSSFLFSEGGDFTQDGQAAINTPAAMKAFTMYGSLLRDYGPPGILNMAFPQAVALFAQGKGAFLTDASGMFVNFNSADKSPVWDKIGYAQFPAGSVGSKPFYVTSWALAMNPRSENKDAGWELIRWLTTKEGITKAQELGTLGARKSVWESPDGTKAFPEDLAKAVQHATVNGVNHNLPEVTNVAEAREAVGSIVVKIILGEDGQEEADKQNAALQKIIDSEQ